MPARTDAFSSDGFVVVRDAIAPDVVRSCVEAIEDELGRHAVDPRDRTTWTEPVVRLACPEGPAFAEAGTSPALRAAYDELLGPGRWIRREGVGGTLPVRFPSLREPGDAGWHIDGSFDVDGAWWANVRSRGRGLLALFLFTDVSDDDAPTELIVGSHLDVPRVLAPFGERGVFYGDVVPHLARFTFERPRARATGRAATSSSATRFSFIAQRGRIAAADRAWWLSRGWRSRSHSRCASVPACIPSSTRSCAASGRGRRDSRPAASRCGRSVFELRSRA